MYATLLMDIEDLITPESDEVAKACAEILAQEDARATLCIVGEKARLLDRRGRADVIAALKLHDIGVHTDLHSIHPTVLEYLAGLDWEDGVQEAIRREEPAVRAIQEIFGVAPSCWGGPGNTWAPQINEAMRELGVPAIVYAHTTSPDDDIHRFGGVFAYPNGHGFSDDWFADEIRTPQHLAGLCQDLKEDSERGVLWRQVFIGHPTRLLHEEFWDEPNFAYGANPSPTAWIAPRRRTAADFDLVLANFRRVVHALRSLPEIELVTIRDMNDMMQKRSFIPVLPEEFEPHRTLTRQKLSSMKDWPILPHKLDITAVCDLTDRLYPTLERIDREHSSWSDAIQ